MDLQNVCRSRALGKWHRKGTIGRGDLHSSRDENHKSASLRQCWERTGEVAILKSLYLSQGFVSIGVEKNAVCVDGHYRDEETLQLNLD